MIYDYYGTPVVKVSTLIALLTTAAIFGLGGFIIANAWIVHHGVCS